MFKTVYHRHRSRRQLEDSYQLAEVGWLVMRGGGAGARGTAPGAAARSGAAARGPRPCLPLHPAGSVLLPYLPAQEGAKLQLEKGQLNCGVELAMLLVEVGRALFLAPGRAGGRLGWGDGGLLGALHIAHLGAPNSFCVALHQLLAPPSLCPQGCEFALFWATAFRSSSVDPPRPPGVRSGWRGAGRGGRGAPAGRAGRLP